MSKPLPPRYQVFISYSSHDQRWANAACAELERRGFRCWMAPRDITPGTEWGAAIIEGIDRCRVMLLIFSSQANGSAQVRREVERAISKGLPVLPLRVEDVRPEGAMEYALGNTHWLDAFTPPIADKLGHMARSVEALLQAGTIQDSPSPEPARGPWLPFPRLRHLVPVAAAALLVVIAAVGAALLSGRRPAGAGGQHPGGGFGQAPAADDETATFQGRWVTVSERVLKKGVVSKKVVGQRKFEWDFDGDTLTVNGLDNDTHLRSLQWRGKVSMKVEDGRHRFDLVGVDSDEKSVHYSGGYSYENSLLKISIDSIDDARAARIPTKGDRGYYAVVLKRAD